MNRAGGSSYKNTKQRKWLARQTEEQIEKKGKKKEGGRTDGTNQDTKRGIHTIHKAGG